MPSDRVVLIPKTSKLDVRMGRAGTPANVRMRVSLEAPRLALELGGRQLARGLAELSRKTISDRFARGLDAHGSPLPPLALATIQRRERRQRQREDELGARQDRYKLRGRPQPGARGSYSTIDTRTPFHETGLYAENVFTTHKGSVTGDMVFLVGGPSGGAAKVTADDGRGARYHAVVWYGEDRMWAIPADLDAEIDRRLDVHLEGVLAAGGSVLGLFSDLRDIAGAVGEVMTEPADGEIE